MIQADFVFKIKPITSRNPQANSNLERVHQTIGNIIRTFKIQDVLFDDDNPWDRILGSTIFTLCAMVHTKTQYTHAKLVFGQNSILNTRHKANWTVIKKCKQDLISKGNK